MRNTHATSHHTYRATRRPLPVSASPTVRCSHSASTHSRRRSNGASLGAPYMWVTSDHPDEATIWFCGIGTLLLCWSAIAMVMLCEHSVSHQVVGMWLLSFRCIPGPTPPRHIVTASPGRRPWSLPAPPAKVARTSGGAQSSGANGSNNEHGSRQLCLSVGLIFLRLNAATIRWQTRSGAPLGVVSSRALAYRYPTPGWRVHRLQRQTPQTPPDAHLSSCNTQPHPILGVLILSQTGAPHNYL